VTPERRGQIEESQFDFHRPDGSIPLVTRRRSLLLDPAVGAERKPDGAPAKRTAEDSTEEMEFIARHQLVPERVAAYSDEAENLIHSDPETAKRFGFRAPIAAGLMAVHFMMAALCEPAPAQARASSRAGRSKTAAGRHQPPDRLRMRIRFRRPMFWNDDLAVLGRRNADGTIAALALINPDGKVANDCIVDETGYGTGETVG
jgi:acyl dehydratase